MSHDATEQECETAGEHTNSPSFAEGCRVGVRVRSGSQRNGLPRHVSRSSLWFRDTCWEATGERATSPPAECEEAYKSVVEAKGESLAIPFRTGCLEVSRKQANKVVKERAKEASKQAKRQTPEENRSASHVPAVATTR